MRLSITALCGLAPAILASVAIREWRNFERRGQRAGFLPIGVALAVLIQWVVFVVLLLRGYIGGFGTHYVTTRAVGWLRLDR